MQFRVQAPHTKLDFQTFATLDEAETALLKLKSPYLVMLEELYTPGNYRRPRYRTIASVRWFTSKKEYEDPSWGYSPTEGPLFAAITAYGREIRWEIPSDPSKPQ